jgi:hypothetical protein
MDPVLICNYRQKILFILNFDTPGWSRECLIDWKPFLKFGLPGIALFFLDYAVYDSGLYLAGKHFALLLSFSNK